MTATSLPILSCPELTSDQIAKASRHLMQTRDALLESVGGLSPAQWQFKLAPDRWSVAEVLEHIILVETAILRNVRATMEAPLAPPEWEPSQIDDFIVNEVPRRTRYADRQGPPKFNAPPQLCPTGRWSTTEAVAVFLDRRAQNLQMLTPALLRGRVIPHPVLGPWDGYQWLLAAGSHCARHTCQIREVQEEPNYPSLSGAIPALAVH